MQVVGHRVRAGDLPGEGLAQAGVAAAAPARARARPLADVLIGLGIAHLGPTSAEALAIRFQSMDNLLAASPPEIAAIDGIGPTIADSVTNFFADDINRSVVDKLAAAGVHLDIVDGVDLPQNLVGLAIVVTGTVPGYSRDDAMAAIKGRGG